MKKLKGLKLEDYQHESDKAAFVCLEKVKAFDKAVDWVIKNTIEEVSKASKHMSEGTDKLVKSFDTIEEISQTAADGTQNVSASTEEQLATMEGVTNSAASLSGMSDDLLNLISTFKIDNKK